MWGDFATGHRSSAGRHGPSHRAGHAVSTAERTNDDEPGKPVSYHPGHRSRQNRRGEHRLPPALAVIVAAVLYASLPGPLLLGPRLLIPALELALLVALVANNP